MSSVRLSPPDLVDLVPATQVRDLIANTDRELADLERQAEDACNAADQAELRAQETGVDGRSATWAMVRMQRFLDGLRADTDAEVESLRDLATAQARRRIADAHAEGRRIRSAAGRTQVTPPVAPHAMCPAAEDVSAPVAGTPPLVDGDARVVSAEPEVVAPRPSPPPVVGIVPEGVPSPVVDAPAPAAAPTPFPAEAARIPEAQTAPASAVSWLAGGASTDAALIGEAPVAGAPAAPPASTPIEHLLQPNGNGQYGAAHHMATAMAAPLPMADAPAEASVAVVHAPAAVHDVVDVAPVDEVDAPAAQAPSSEFWTEPVTKPRRGLRRIPVSAVLEVIAVLLILVFILLRLS
jgi:hypothetical protein